MAIAGPLGGFPGAWRRAIHWSGSTWMAMSWWLRVIWVVSVACGLTGIVVYSGHLLDGTALEVVDTAAYVVTPLGSGLVMLLATARLVGRRRWAWLTIGTGVVLWGVGEMIWQAYVLIGVDPPYPGVADLFYLAAYPLMFVGVLLLPQLRSHKWERVRLSLDAVAGTVAIVAIAWTAYLSDAISLDPEAGLLGNLVTMAYPIADLCLLIAVLILATRRSSFRLAGRLMTLAAAMLITAIADVTYTIQVAAGTYKNANPLDAVWLAGYVMFAITAFLVAGPVRVREQADRPSRLWPMLAPYTAVAALFLITVWKVGGRSTLLQAATVGVGLLVIVRQSVAIRETRDVVETQRNDLVASISHELRTPLTAIAGFMEILDEDSDLDSDERVEMIGIVNTQTQHLGRIVGDLLQMVRGGLQDLPLTVEDFTVDDLVASTIEMLDNGPGTPTVTSHIEPGLTIRADRGRIRQVLLNYLTNAARYGKGVVEIRAKSTSNGDLIEVHDNGPGIPKKYEFRIWERFERGAQTLSSEVQGSGLGLPIARGLVAAHHGHTGYRPSERLGGSCFWLTIPCLVSGKAPD
jgi:signal transduction histidine kinase